MSKVRGPCFWPIPSHPRQRRHRHPSSNPFRGGWSWPLCLCLVSHRPMPMAPGESLAKPKVKTLGGCAGLQLDMPICFFLHSLAHTNSLPLRPIKDSGKPIAIIRDFPGHSPAEISNHPRPRCFRLVSA